MNSSPAALTFRPRLRSFSAWASSILISVPLLLAFPAATTAAYYGDCDAAGAYNPKLLPRVDRTRADIGSSNSFWGAYGTTVIKALRSCINPNGDSTKGKSLVFPANLAAGSNHLVQVGYGRVDCAPGPPCPGPDNQLTFFYTPEDLIPPAGNLAVFPGAETPEIGNTYSFKVEWNGTSSWIFQIKDLTDNQTWTTTTNATWHDGAYVFYGFEVGRYWDQLGYTSATPAIVRDLQYRRSDIAGWRVLTGDPTETCTATTNTCILDEAPYPFHKAQVTTAPGPYASNQTIVKAWTVSH